MWNKIKINQWCWHFIINNNRIPTQKDVNQINSPTTSDITRHYLSLDNLIESCGPVCFNQHLINGGNSFGNLKNGFLRYYNEYGRYPSSLEIDKYQYLPSSRTIQRSWGGLETLRKAMGLEITNYTKGKTRSHISAYIGTRGQSEENKLEKILQKKFGEVFVHTQKRIGQVRADFFIYTPSGNFAIDIFCFEDKNCFLGDINIKLKTYKDYPHPVIYLPINNRYSSKDIKKWIDNKKNPIPTNQKVISYKNFIVWINTLSAYQNPLCIIPK